MNTEQSDPTLALLVSQGFSHTIIDRFWAKVQKTDGCWLWIGAKSGHVASPQYGKMHIKGHVGPTAFAHRVSWMIHRGIIPDGLCVLHNCPGGDNSLCVNPDHLFLGTRKDNLVDCARKQRTHKGYKLSDEQVIQIIRARHTMTGKAIAALFNISQGLVSEIVHGLRYQRIWSNLGEIPLTTDGRKRKITNS